MKIDNQRASFEAWLRVKPCGAAHDFAWEAWQARAALQSQDREDAIPAYIRLMAQRIAADTFDHCTADPIFTVERRRTITGLDTNYTDNIGWFDTDSGNRVEGEEAVDLEARYDVTGDEPEGYVRTGYFEEWEHCATYITLEAAQAFAESKGEKYRVYVDSGCRNHEWKALRAFLLSIDHARRSEGDRE